MAKKPAAKKPEGAVVKKDTSTALSASGAFEAHAGEGFENVTAKDILIPRISILQALSPQLKATKSEFIDGAKEGMICDVATGELLPTPLIVIPVFYIKQYLEWAPRASGKGLCGIHDSDAILDKCTEDDKGRPILDNGNYIAETAQFFVLNMMANRRRSFIPMASTQLKNARKWMTLATGEKLQRGDGSEYTPPIFYRSYSLDTVPESNVEGDWVGWKVSRGERMEDMGENWNDIFEDALEFRGQLISGKAKADVASMQEGTGDVTDGAM